eukprot:1177135-Prorocentrum_minimum.AAC.3
MVALEGLVEHIDGLDAHLNATPLARVCRGGRGREQLARGDRGAGQHVLTAPVVLVIGPFPHCELEPVVQHQRIHRRLIPWYIPAKWAGR